MPKITVTYFLTQEGQKQSLLEGGDGKEVQKYVVNDVEDPELIKTIIELGQVDRDGNVSLVIGDSASFSGGRRVDIVGWEPTLVNCALVRDAPEEWDLPGWRETAYYDHYAPRPIRAPIDFDVPMCLTLLVNFERERREAISDDAKTACADACADKNQSPEIVAAFEAAEQRAEAALLKAKQQADQRREGEAERRQKIAAATTEREAWVREHGSEHLKTILDEGLLENSLAIYRDERLAKERPGWIWDNTWLDGEVELRDPRNPIPEDLTWLREVRQTVPNVQLRWAHFGTYDDHYDSYYGAEGEVNPVREMVLTAEFLDRTIVLRRD
jgi:hypothetical protein